jgi:cytoskeletal protein RodZ
MADNEFHLASAPLTGAGPQLKAAREAAGLTLAQIAASTRIPVRMLELLEAGNFAALPGRTYATGFTRSYARAVGLDEEQLAAAVRREVSRAEHPEQRQAPAFEPGDPARVPTARIAWLAALAALLAIAAVLVWWRTLYAPAMTLPPLVPDVVATTPAPETGPPPAPPLPTGLPMDAASGGAMATAGAMAQAPIPSPRPAARPRTRAPSNTPDEPVPLEAPVAAASP